MTFIRSIKDNSWRTASKYSDFDEIQLLIPEWFFSVQASDYRVSYSLQKPFNEWRFDKKFTLSEFVFSSGKDGSIC